MRFAAGVEYEGTAYAGWQSQSHARGVQAEVEAALSHVADAPVSVACAGRTDAGVHALGQVIHFDSGAQRPVEAWLLGANSHLPADISLRWVRPVSGDFHARHSARSRRYRYVIHNSRSRTGLFAQRAYWCKAPLDAVAMHAAAQCLKGEHDFSAFRAAECQSRTPFRNVSEVSVVRRGESVAIDVEANAFLHHMVRNIAGALIEVGRGERPTGWLNELLAGCDRRLGGITAGPEGLYFLLVRYDDALRLPVPVWPDLPLTP